MSLYTIALFLHVSGAIGACVSLGIWLFGLAALRRTRLVEQVRALAWLIIIASPLMVMSVLLLGVGGFEMALSTWGLSTPWVAVSLVSVVLIGPIGAFVLDPKMRLIAASARAIPDGTLPQTLFRRTHDPILEIAANTLTSLLLGIVFLMTTKPQLLPSLLVMGIAFLLGIFVSLLRWLVERDARYPPDYLNDGEEADPFMRKTFWTRQW